MSKNLKNKIVTKKVIAYPSIYIQIICLYVLHLEKEMAAHSSILAWRTPGMEEPVSCHPWGRTESDTTEATQQQQQPIFHYLSIYLSVYPDCFRNVLWQDKNYDL